MSAMLRALPATSLDLEALLQLPGHLRQEMAFRWSNRHPINVRLRVRCWRRACADKHWWRWQRTPKRQMGPLRHCRLPLRRYRRRQRRTPRPLLLSPAAATAEVWQARRPHATPAPPAHIHAASLCPGRLAGWAGGGVALGAGAGGTADRVWCRARNVGAPASLPVTRRPRSWLVRGSCCGALWCVLPGTGPPGCQDMGTQSRERGRESGCEGEAQLDVGGWRTRTRTRHPSGHRSAAIGTTACCRPTRGGVMCAGVFAWRMRPRRKGVPKHLQARASLGQWSHLRNWEWVTQTASPEAS